MGGHVVVTFVVVPICAITVGCPPFRQCLKVVAHRWIGVLGKDHRATRVYYENVGDPRSNLSVADDLSDLFRDLGRTAPASRYFEGLLMRHLCAGAYAFPVLPKPPSPRELASNSSTTLNATCITGTTTSCASRSSGLIVKPSFPRFQVEIMISP